MEAASRVTQTARELRWAADSYEQAQRVRVQTGEQIRAVLQGRDASWGPLASPEKPEEVLLRIRRGEAEGPVPPLGRSYRRAWEQEQEMTALLAEYLRAHPAWGWLRRVRGIGPTLAGKLLARLDVARADTPSAFWAYCGLATVPGVEYRCAACGLTGSFPVHYRVSGQHARLGEGRPCPGSLVPVLGPEAGVRVAQPRPGRGERAAYDRQAKKICYLVGTSFLRAGGRYEQLYRRERAKLDRTRPGWAEGRKHLTALRKTEKVFLAHLWITWREALGLPVTAPYAHAHQPGHDSWIGPWEMVDDPRPPADAARAARRAGSCGPPGPG